MRNFVGPNMSVPISCEFKISMEFKFEILRDANSMELGFHLVKQLTPNITQTEYTQYVSEMIKQGYFQVVVKDLENKIVAVSGIWIGTKLYCGKYMEMDNVVVDSTYRSAGIGKLLYDYCLNLAKENNCKAIMLDAFIENTRAHEFYEQKGFVKRGFHFIKSL